MHLIQKRFSHHLFLRAFFFFLLFMFCYQQIGWWGGWWFWENTWQPQYWKNTEVRYWGLQGQEGMKWLVEDDATLKSWSQWRPVSKKIYHLASGVCQQFQVNGVGGQFLKVLLHKSAQFLESSRTSPTLSHLQLDLFFECLELEKGFLVQAITTWLSPMRAVFCDPLLKNVKGASGRTALDGLVSSECLN